MKILPHLVCYMSGNFGVGIIRWTTWLETQAQGMSGN
jgi:hypothetical protein